jgi:hypothetical protein
MSSTATRERAAAAFCDRHTTGPSSPVCYLALLLDALRPEAATPLPVPPISPEEIERALGVAE